MRNKDLLTLYMKYSSNVFPLKQKLEGSIHDFFEDYCEENSHIIEVYTINDNGKYIVLKDFVPVNSKDHIPLEYIQAFCDSYNMTCESITHEESVITPLTDNYHTQGNVYTILFEIKRDDSRRHMLIPEVLEED